MNSQICFETKSRRLLSIKTMPSAIEAFLKFIVRNGGELRIKFKKRISNLTKIKMLCHSLSEQEKNKAPKQ
jgi:Holliday junction resolvase